MPNDGADRSDRSADIGTRDLVVRRLLEHGPTTAMDLAGVLGLSGAAVRRHLDALVAEGSVTTRDAPRASGRGRGRPARQHLLTDEGRRRADRGADDVAGLAVEVLRELGAVAGEEAVRAFARRRVLALLDGHEVAASPERADRLTALAEALCEEGYATSTRPSSAGAQLCQHHCPVAGVAAEFPQLCEAETAVFAELLDTHVQRLSTIARGDAACTTHVPLQADPPPGPAGVPQQSTTTVVQGRQVV